MCEVTFLVLNISQFFQFRGLRYFSLMIEDYFDGSSRRTLPGRFWDFMHSNSLTLHDLLFVTRHRYHNSHVDIRPLLLQRFPLLRTLSLGRFATSTYAQKVQLTQFFQNHSALNSLSVDSMNLGFPFPISVGLPNITQVSGIPSPELLQCIQNPTAIRRIDSRVYVQSISALSPNADSLCCGMNLDPRFYDVDEAFANFVGNISLDFRNLRHLELIRCFPVLYHAAWRPLVSSRNGCIL